MGNKYANAPCVPACLTYDVQMKIVIDQIYIDFQIELYRSNVFQKCSYIFKNFITLYNFFFKIYIILQLLLLNQ